MTDDELQLLSRNAGLERMWARFPDEVRAAALAAQETGAALRAMDDGAWEPRPPATSA